ncbi:MAG: molybdate transport system substrate-binding protein [Verrucomicrobiales bacterium]
MKQAVIAIALALILGICVFSLQNLGNPGEERGGKLLVFCAAGVKKPVAAIARQYEEEFGVKVQLQYGGTSTLLSQVQIAKRGDLFIAADDTAVEAAREKGVVREVLALAVQYPVIAVAEGNPKGIRSIDDLLRDDVRVAIGNPGAASIGKATRRGMGAHWDAFEKKVAVMKPTVTEIAQDLKVDAVDAAVIWNSTVPQFKGLEMVRVAEFDAELDNVSVSVLTAGEQSAEALKFARYLAAPEKGGAIFERMKFEVVTGDAWAERPDLVLFSGGVNRPAVEDLVKEFAAREGVDVTTVFNGCGVLCAQMQAMNVPPDAYYACDICFVPPVAEQFPEVVILTETRIGIAKRKNLSQEISTLMDLARPGIKVGICNQKQSTLGYMTAGMLKQSGLAEAVRKNVVVEVPTADLLINQLRTNALDAAIVYEVNALLVDEHLDFVAIRHPGAIALQPFGVNVGSPREQLARRLEDFFRANPEAFVKAGFVWRGDEAPLKSSEIKIPEWLK